MYYHLSDGGKHRYRPYAWVCIQCGELHHADRKIPEEWLPKPERVKRRAMEEPSRSDRSSTLTDGE
jgi:hypothetical protein